MRENQHIEWKAAWQDEHLKWICGFANAFGGILQIGKNDHGHPVPIKNEKKLLEDIPNKIRNHLGLTLDVHCITVESFPVIEIRVPPQSIPVSFRGRYYYRTGSTLTELTGANLNDFLLKKAGRSWDASFEERADANDIDEKSIQRFRKDASAANRLPLHASVDTLELLERLRLTQKGKLTCAALVLFGKDPMQFYPGISVQIGKFGLDHTDLRFQEVIEGNLVHCLYETMDQLTGKFLTKSVQFKGIQRFENYPYPIEAFREILLNALIHRRYPSGAHLQIRVYDDRMIFWNDGPLPDEISLASLLSLHASHPRNPLIADTCFKAGYIDRWGRGIEKATSACQSAGLPPPEFQEADGGLRVTLFAQTAPPTAYPRLESRLESALSRHQVNILRKCLNHSSITDLMEIAGRSDRTKFRNQVLRPLLDEGLLEMTLPDKPTSSLQQYRTTNLGRAALSQEPKA